MGRRRERPAEGSFAWRLECARLDRGLSHASLARAAELSKRRVIRLERGTAVPTASEVQALATACFVSVGDLATPGHDLALVGGGTEDATIRGSAAVDALLREYIAMVLEMRNRDEIPVSSLRHEDLTELSRALGDSPEAIETRLIELVGTDSEGAQRLRAAIQPSVT
jgi:transcriptional regulator with XRE-family HTH domain